MLSAVGLKLISKLENSLHFDAVVYSTLLIEEKTEKKKHFENKINRKSIKRKSQTVGFRWKGYKIKFMEN